MSFRRNLLTALLAGGAVAAAKVLMSATAKDRNRYKKLINIQLKLVAIQDNINNSHEVACKLYEASGIKGPHAYPWPSASPELRAQMDAQFSTLLELLIDKFDGSQELKENYGEMLDKVRAVFNRTTVIDTFSEEDLKRWENTVISIAVMRHMLADRRMAFNPNKSKGWDKFVDRYCKVILEA